MTREPAAAVVASADVIGKAKWRLKAARAEHSPMVTACLIILCNYKNRSAELTSDNFSRLTYFICNSPRGAARGLGRLIFN